MMEHETRHHDGVTVVELRGSAAVADALALRDVLGSHLAGGDSRVLLDMTGLRFIDSAGIGVLVSARRRAEQLGATLALAGVNGAVARVLQMTRADRLVQTFQSVEEGVDALSKRSSGAGE